MFESQEKINSNFFIFMREFFSFWKNFSDFFWKNFLEINFFWKNSTFFFSTSSQENQHIKSFSRDFSTFQFRNIYFNLFINKYLFLLQYDEKQSTSINNLKMIQEKNPLKLRRDIRSKNIMESRQLGPTQGALQLTPHPSLQTFCMKNMSTRRLVYLIFTISFQTFITYSTFILKNFIENFQFSLPLPISFEVHFLLMYI